MLQLIAESEAVRRVRLYDEGRIAVLLFPYELMQSIGVSGEHLDTLIDVLRSIEGVEVAAVIKQSAPDAPFRVSMRSKVDVDVAKICASFGGGGHARAAGCTIIADTAKEAEEKLLAKIGIL
jgi:phosphoesterase RecJ-like protein